MNEMKKPSVTNVERIIAKIDNDFNPDNSDWIPRVGAWVIDAMNQINALKTKRKKIKIPVNERIAIAECNLDNVIVYDKNGCKLKEETEECRCGMQYPSTGRLAENSINITANTITYENTGNEETANYAVAEPINDKRPYQYNVHLYKYGTTDKCKTYVIIDNNKIELNFDTDYIYIECDYIETVCSDMYNCELPVIPNNGMLIEAITYYCMYKMLTRGYKHPVMNLGASQYGTNPYYLWHTMKEEARRSIINQDIDNDSSKLFRSGLYINTFDPRN